MWTQTAPRKLDTKPNITKSISGFGIRFSPAESPSVMTNCRVFLLTPPLQKHSHKRCAQSTDAEEGLEMLKKELDLPNDKYLKKSGTTYRVLVPRAERNKYIDLMCKQIE